MGFKKKKNLIILSAALGICFFMYQLYFFLTISAENSNSRVIQVIAHSDALEVLHLRSEDDKYINEHGILRGVLSVNMPRYRPDDKNQFKCLTSGEVIPFEQVNDDYCDCEDASDEPSTNACLNGVFNCDSQYKNKPVAVNHVPSSMVNDGICDCCDGSDEWLHKPHHNLLTQGSVKLKRRYAKECPNICFEK